MNRRTRADINVEHASFDVVGGQLEGDDEIFLVGLAQQAPSVLIGQGRKLLKLEFCGGGQGRPFAVSVFASQNVLHFHQRDIVDGRILAQAREALADLFSGGGVAVLQCPVELLGLLLEVAQRRLMRKIACGHRVPSFVVPDVRCIKGRKKVTMWVLQWRRPVAFPRT